MKQILQDLNKGDTMLVELPVPKSKKNHLLIKTSKSIISAGTERMLVDFGKASWIDKARQQPDKVKMVIDKVKTDGLLPTLEAVKSKLEHPLPLGYCNAGTVIASEVHGFKEGDRVVSNGPHAEIVRVGGNLCAKIPDNVDDESAAFTVLGSIALQGIRLANPTMGEKVAVIGLGLIGLIAVQLLKANGCQVIGIDFDEEKCKLAESFGAKAVRLSQNEDPVDRAMKFTNNRGVDAVLITAATQSNLPIKQAANMSRKRGRIVLVGVVGLELSRADFYEKELTFQVSCSYGPGRYDSDYEEKGNDYPIGFVRWTEQRNFEAILDLMSSGQLDMRPLISHRFSFNDALDGYRQLNNKQSLGIILDYANSHVDHTEKTIILSENIEYHADDVIVGGLGAGAYASRVLLPAFKRSGVQLDTLVTSGGASASIQGTRNGFTKASTDEDAIFKNDNVNTVVISTRHNLHASQVIKALQNKKHVFVEKPLAINLDELNQIKAVYDQVKTEGLKLMVGFNRRFSPHVLKLKELVDKVNSPKSFIFTINAGAIPEDHWTQSMDIGGGRIIGEACHFIDLMRHLAGSKIIDYSSVQIGESEGTSIRNDNVSINLCFEDGSFGTIHYLSNGSKSFSKERLEVFAGGAIIQIDNFRKMKSYGWPGFRKLNLLSQNKGQQNCVYAFVNSIKNGTPTPISPEELFEVAEVTIKVSESLAR